MTIDSVRKDLENHIGKEVTLKYNKGRNKVEKYHVVIKELYNYVFLVELNNNFNEVKSFSYTDIITKTIKIDY